MFNFNTGRYTYSQVIFYSYFATEQKFIRSGISDDPNLTVNES